MQTLAKKASNRAKSKFKGPQARVCPSYLRNSKEVSVAGVEKTREKNSGGKKKSPRRNGTPYVWGLEGCYKSEDGVWIGVGLLKRWEKNQFWKYSEGRANRSHLPIDEADFLAWAKGWSCYLRRYGTLQEGGDLSSYLGSVTLFMLHFRCLWDIQVKVSSKQFNLWV